MSEEIKEKLDLFPNKMNDIAKEAYYQLENYITNLQQENERLEKNNNELRKIYKNTCKHLFNIEHDELARYFQAQIDECSTFQVETIDWYKECQDYKSRIDKAIEYIDKLWSFPGGNYEIAINERDSIDIDGNDYFDNLLNILQGSDKK